MSSRRFLFLLNPISGHGNKGGLQQQLQQWMEEAKTEAHFYPTVASGNYQFLHPIIEEKNISDVIICGGDGTINSVVSALKHFAIRFGIIPCGSGNGLALSAGIPRNPQKALSIILEGNAKAVDAFTINQKFACMLCGLGFDAQVAHSFAQSPERGLRTYIKKSVQHFFSAPVYPFVISTGAKKFKLDAYFISIANSNQFGNNVTIAPQASLTDGLLDVVIATDQNKILLLWQTLLQVLGFNALGNAAVDKKGIIYFQTPALRIHNESEAPLHIDGDPVPTEKVLDIKIITGCFWLLVP